MKLLAAALASFAFTPALMAAGTSTVDGTWHVTGDVQGNPVNPTCILAQKDDQITGTCTGTDGKAMPVKGTVKGNSIKWQYDTVYQAGGITIAFTASFDKEDHLAGGVFVEPYAVDGSFTATRDKPATPPPA